MLIFRCTRVEPYQHLKNRKERTDPTWRQGFYISAKSADSALSKMQKQFPDDKLFTADIWKPHESSNNTSKTG